MAPAQTLPLAPPRSPYEIALREAGEDIQIAAKPRACFQCYGNPARFSNRHLKQYSCYKGLLRHFWDVHLDDRHCSYYNESLDEMYWRRRTVDKHRLSIRYLGDYPRDLLWVYSQALLLYSSIITIDRAWRGQSKHACRNEISNNNRQLSRLRSAYYFTVLC